MEWLYLLLSSSGGGSSDFGFFIIFLGVSDIDVIGEDGLNTSLTGGVLGKHDLDLNTHNTLLEGDVSDGNIQEIELGLTGTDHVSLLELHALSSLLSQFTGDDNFTTSSTFLNDVSDDRDGSHSDGDTLEELELDDFSLGSSAHTLLEDGGNLKINGIGGISESLLDQRGKFSDLLAFLTEDVLDLSSLDSDFSLDGGNSDFDTSITSGGQSSGKESVEFSVEDTIGNELLLLVHGSDLSLSVHGYGLSFCGNLMMRIFIILINAPK